MLNSYINVGSLTNEKKNSKSCFCTVQNRKAAATHCLLLPFGAEFVQRDRCWSVVGRGEAAAGPSTGGK